MLVDIDVDASNKSNRLREGIIIIINGSWVSRIISLSDLVWRLCQRQEHTLANGQRLGDTSVAGNLQDRCTDSIRRNHRSLLPFLLPFGLYVSLVIQITF